MLRLPLLPDQGASHFQANDVLMRMLDPPLQGVHLANARK
jgi:hypothetical protein